MNEGSTSEITQILQAWRSGEPHALESLLPIVYAELHRQAHFQLRQERPDHTLQSSALVNEAYLRLGDMNHPKWESRTHFFAIAAQLMRQILVDYARRRRAEKRGGGLGTISLEDADKLDIGKERPLDIVALDDALNTLARFDKRKAKVVEMRYFGGLNFEESARVLNVSALTVSRDWSTAKAWLHRELTHSPSTEEQDPTKKKLIN